MVGFFGGVVFAANNDSKITKSTAEVQKMQAGVYLLKDANFSAGTYLVIAPRVVRPSLPYAVSVNILKSSENEHIVRVEVRTAQNDTIGARVVNNVKTGS